MRSNDVRRPPDYFSVFPPTSRRVENTPIFVHLAVGSDGHLRSCPSGLGGVVGCRETRRYDRLVGTRRIRVGTWNVWSLTGKRLELADALGRHNVNIACFQETKWKGSSTREGNRYKLWYSGSSSGRNGVGVILTARLKDNVVQVNRCGDRIMALSVVIEGETVNVISAYASQGQFKRPYRIRCGWIRGEVTLERARTAGPSLVRHAHLNI
ncbi:retrovirus-related pol polyprotein LINE-1, partial [Tanacetum coccineum]